VYIKLIFLIIFFLFPFSSKAQEGIPVYSDYLTDNYYLLHPSMAGAASCDKLRITGRKQWFGQEDAPELQTLNFNTRIGEKSGVGMIIFNDKNGYHSQKGVKLTYAHHIMFSRDDIDLNQLSFGMSTGFFQRQLDETNFVENDPLLTGQVQRNSNLNIDVGLSYNFLNYYIHLTVLGALEYKNALYGDFESKNIRRYIFSTGHAFGDKKTILWEPSVLFQMIDATKEKLIDINLKVHRDINFDLGSIWGGISYRRSLEGAQYKTSSGVASQKLQYITPFLGVTYKQLMIGYTYSRVSGPILFDQGAYHQITLGFNFNCKQEYFIGSTL
jgi:type IX secretion system PorP/SprF family membrane protein